MDSFSPKSIRKLYTEKVIFLGFTNLFKIISMQGKEKIRNLLIGLIAETADESLKTFFQNSLDEVFSVTSMNLVQLPFDSSDFDSLVIF